MASDVDRAERSIRVKQTIRVVLIVVLVLIVALWAFANDQDVEVDWLVDSTSAPLVVVILGSAAVGFIVGLLAGAKRR